MDAEDYQVIASFHENAKDELRGTLGDVGFEYEPPPCFGASADCLVLETPECFIECEISETKISLRHAVCQLSDADRTFVKVLWPIRDVVCGISFVDVEDELIFDDFQVEENLAEWMCESASEKRHFWFADFPSKERKCRVKDAFDGTM